MQDIFFLIKDLINSSSWSFFFLFFSKGKIKSSTFYSFKVEKLSGKKYVGFRRGKRK